MKIQHHVKNLLCNLIKFFIYYYFWSRCRSIQSWTVWLMTSLTLPLSTLNTKRGTEKMSFLNSDFLSFLSHSSLLLHFPQVSWS